MINNLALTLALASLAAALSVILYGFACYHG
jgi:hypothetical protein